MNALSCSSKVLCAVVGRNVYAWDGSSWHEIVYGDSELIENFVSCGSDGCLTSLIDIEGSAETYIYRPGVSPPPRPGDNPGIRALSCVTLQFCMGVDGDNHAWRWHATTAHWTRALMTSPGGVPDASISCGSTTFCVAVGDRFQSTWDGTTWSAPQAIVGRDVTPFSGLIKVSCRPGICAAMDYRGWVVVAT